MEAEGSPRSDIATLLLAECVNACADAGQSPHDISIMVLFLKH